jgi:hypothetical protein
MWLYLACRLTQLWHKNGRKGTGIVGLGYIGHARGHE